MKISELGEFGLVNALQKMISEAQDTRSEAWRQLIIGIGDDTAAWQCNDAIQLATVDSLRQDVHFTLKMTSWEELGWKALATNLSDIAAMGGIPRYALVALSLPADTEMEDALALYRGILDLARRHSVAVIGGDTDSAPKVDISITVIGGTGQEKGMLLRSAARTGDKVAVTGRLGAAAAGLEMLLKGLEFDSKTTASLRNAFLRPVPRIAEGRILLEAGVKSAIDVSDGLISDLRHICQASQVSARVEVDRVPVAPEAKATFPEKALEFALSGGEDYELLFTAPAEIIERVMGKSACPITVIGEITEGNAGNITLFDSQGKPFRLPEAGWEHFKSKQKNVP